LSGLVGGAGGAVAARLGTAVASKVGAGLGGRMVTEAAENGVEDVFSQVTTTGRVDVKSAALGMIPGLNLISVGGGGGGCKNDRRGGGRKHSFEPSTQVLMAGWVEAADRGRQRGRQGHRHGSEVG
jgi:hypothetical protein